MLLRLCRYSVLFRDFAGQFLVNDLLEDFKRLGADHGQSVYEEGRRGLHTHVYREIRVRLDEGVVAVARQACLEGVHIQPKLGGILDIDGLSHVFAAEYFFVIRPEGILLVGAA